MDEANAPSLEQDPALLQDVKRVVSATLGRPVTFSSMQRLSSADSRNAVYRCFLTPGSQPPDTLIVKKALGVDLTSEGQTGEGTWETMRFFNDWIGAEFIASLQSEPPLSARLYGGDRSGNFYVLEDLGEHHSLVEPLLHGDAAAAEDALFKYSTCLGKFHALTAGKAGAFETLFASRLPGLKPFAYETSQLDARVEKVQSLLEELGVPAGEAQKAELQAVVDTITRPGPFLAYIHSDPCPDNLFDMGDHFRLIDFEAGHFGHALLDGVYPRIIFPTCWCANRLPKEFVKRMENRYRAELVKGCPQAQEDALWETALVHLCANAVMMTLFFHLEFALKEDREWGIATIRQRHLARLEAFIDTTIEFHRLPALRDMAGKLLEMLRSRWPETPPLPLYPAFNR